VPGGKIVATIKHHVSQSHLFRQCIARQPLRDGKHFTSRIDPCQRALAG
jgi:hypothetical protein